MRPALQKKDKGNYNALSWQYNNTFYYLYYFYIMIFIMIYDTIILPHPDTIIPQPGIKFQW